jgi:hypothetical protein
VVAELQAKAGGRSRLGDSMAATHSIERELVRLRRALEEERSEIDRLRGAEGAAGLAESMRRESREKLDGDMARLRLEWTKAAEEQEEAFRRVCPFVFEHAISLRDECRKAPDKRRPFSGHCQICRSRFHRRYSYLLCSAVGESHRSTW